MKRLIIFVAFIFCSFSLTASSYALLYGIGGSVFYTIDTNDGSYNQKNVFPLSIPGNAGFTTYDGKTFYTNSNDYLYEFDQTGITNYWRPNNIDGLTFVGSSLWGMNEATNQFYQIDTSTGALHIHSQYLIMLLTASQGQIRPLSPLGFLERFMSLTFQEI